MNKSFVLLALLAGLVLACASGCNPQTGIVIPDNNPTVVVQPETPVEGEPEAPAEGEPEMPTEEGEPEAPAEGEPETPVEPSGGIVITGTLFKNLPATKAMSLNEKGLTTEELNQAFVEIAQATDGLTLVLDGQGENDYKRSSAVQSDGSFFLRLTSVLPGNYKLSLNTSSTTTGIAGWGKSDVDVTIEAGKVTSVTVTLERMKTFAIRGHFSDELAEDEDWYSFEAFLVDTAGNNYPAILAVGDEGWVIDGYNIPVSAIIEAVKVTGDDIETMILAIDVTNTHFDNGYSLFDVIDNEALIALTPGTGDLDVTVPPIDPIVSTARAPKILIDGVIANEATVTLGQKVKIEVRIGDDPVPIGHACNGILDGFVQTSPPVNHPQFAPPIEGRWESSGKKNLSVSCYVPEVGGVVDVSFQLEVINNVDGPTIFMEQLIYSHVPRGNLAAIIAVPPGDDLRNHLTTPIGEVAYVGVASTHFNNWAWDPILSPDNPDTFWVGDLENLETLAIRTRFNQNVFRGNIFAIDVNGNMAFLNLSRWKVIYKNGLVSDDDVIIDDGSGGLIIEIRK